MDGASEILQPWDNERHETMYVSGMCRQNRPPASLSHTRLLGSGPKHTKRMGCELRSVRHQSADTHARAQRRTRRHRGSRERERERERAFPLAIAAFGSGRNETLFPLTRSTACRSR
ncbi:hypothetical protein CDEST_06031 [Colletotrichum destructivum]|uniref:Uncharacterized protein n=1 Tax=Colletotrichum destructivum TaxID=34406 RepID=A0AAX4ICR2_9PEZI|nr:hypothetical protein CDEST_06031 [Colletotrichum destructivum]